MKRFSVLLGGLLALAVNGSVLAATFFQATLDPPTEILITAVPSETVIAQLQIKQILNGILFVDFSKCGVVPGLLAIERCVLFIELSEFLDQIVVHEISWGDLRILSLHHGIDRSHRGYQLPGRCRGICCPQPGSDCESLIVSFR